MITGDPNELTSWAGSLDGEQRGTASTAVFAILERSEGGTGAFKVRATDGHVYWLKVPTNPQGVQSVVHEVVAAEIGRLLDAPVRPVTLCEVTPRFDGWEYATGHRLHPTTAHASLAVDRCYDYDAHIARSRDHNSKRQARLIGLWEFLQGSDPQWLYDADNDSAIWSFDHGFWFGGEWGWSRESLVNDVSLPWQWPGSLLGLDFHEFADVANRIDALSSSDVLAAVARTPLNWGMPDSDLEALGWFIYTRRSAASSRLASLAGAQR